MDDVERRIAEATFASAFAQAVFRGLKAGVAEEAAALIASTVVLALRRPKTKDVDALAMIAELKRGKP